MKKQSWYERYDRYGKEVTFLMAMRKHGLSVDDLDPSKNDPAEDNRKKAKKMDIQWKMRFSGITVEHMKEFLTYVNPNPVSRPPSLPPVAARDDDAKQQMDDVPVPLASTGDKEQMDDGVPNKRPAPLAFTAADDKQQMDDGFPNKRHCHDPAPTGGAAADKEQMDDGVPNKPHGLP